MITTKIMLNKRNQTKIIHIERLNLSTVQKQRQPPHTQSDGYYIKKNHIITCDKNVGKLKHFCTVSGNEK